MDKITEIRSAYIACIAELNKDWVGSINQYGNISTAIEKLRDKALEQVKTPVQEKKEVANTAHVLGTIWDIIDKDETDGTVQEMTIAKIEGVIKRYNQLLSVPVQESNVLLVTEDGVTIYRGDRTTLLYAYNTESGVAGEVTSYGVQFPIRESWKHFSTPEARQEWIEYNKPCLSQKEVNDMMINKNYPGTWDINQKQAVTEYIERIKCALDVYVMNKLKT